MKKIIFDLDGTLYQTKATILNAVNESLKEFNLPLINESILCSLIGKTTDDFLREIINENIDFDSFKKVLRKNEHRLVKETAVLFPDIVKLLEELSSRGYKLNICSNGSEEYINLVLETTSINKYFTNIYSSKNFINKSECIKQIIDTSDFNAVVGDTMIDIEAATNNNIVSIGAAYGYGDINDISKATFIAENPLEIADKIIQAELFYTLENELIKKNKSKIIGINGVDTSGKTTFTNYFSKYLSHVGIKNTVVHIDDFHNPSSIRSQGDNPIDAYYNNAFNYNQLINELLEPLKTYQSINKTICCLNLDTDKYENYINYNIDSDTVVLIEGVLLFRSPLNDYLDDKIFINIDFDEVLNRALIRDVPKYGLQFLDKYKNKYIPIQKKYIAEWEPFKNSSIVIDNNNYNRPVLTKCEKGL